MFEEFCKSSFLHAEKKLSSLSRVTEILGTAQMILSPPVSLGHRFISPPPPGHFSRNTCSNVGFLSTFPSGRCGNRKQTSRKDPSCAGGPSGRVRRGGHMTATSQPISVDVTPRETPPGRPSFKFPRRPVIGRSGPRDQRSREVLGHARDRKRIVANSFKLCCKH